MPPKELAAEAQRNHPLRPDLEPDSGYPAEDTMIGGMPVRRCHVRTPLWEVYSTTVMGREGDLLGHVQGILGNRTQPWKYVAVFNMLSPDEFHVPCRTLHAATICLLGGEDKARERAGEEITV